MSFSGRRVTIMGLGRHGGGEAAARYLAAQGARVTVTDRAAESSLTESLAALAGAPIERFTFGGHRGEDFREADVVVVNPAVRLDDDWVRQAREAGAIITSEIEIFLRACPGRVIGVTGSNGKSTTTSMIAAGLAGGSRDVWCGGNIGRSLLGDLPRIAPDDWVVLELSSFQLAWLSDDAPRPAIAVVTNCAANHLDWHGDFAAYRSAKQRLLDQGPSGVAVLPADDPEVAAWSRRAAGRVVAPWPPAELPQLAAPGEHNRRNAALAAAVCREAGLPEAAFLPRLAAFPGLPMRLEFVAEVAGRRFYNDSQATTPESTCAALDALPKPIWLLAGGGDKGSSFANVGTRVARHARGAAFFGATRGSLRDATLRADSDFNCVAFETLDEAFAWCWRQSRAGDTIVLSPACASFDQFRDCAERGATFIKLVDALRS